MRWNRPESNIHLWDRLVRLLLGLSLVALGVLWPTWWGLLAIWPLATGLLAWSPIYSLLGFSTCRYRFDQNVCDESKV